MVKVIIIGGGNVAFHLTQHLLKSKSVQVVQVYNRSIEKIQYLKNSTSITNQLNQLKEADVYIISVSDNAIATLSKQLQLKEKLVVHTSGSVALNNLKSNANKGVFYPLQTFSKERKASFTQIPICIEAERKEDLALLQTLAKAVSNTCYTLNSQQRKSLHVAAVFVNNFVNHLYHIGHEICTENKVPFQILQPLIEETAAKIVNLTPFNAQTGPAKRNDTITIDKHVEMLQPNQKEIYTLLTKHIYKTHGKKP